MKVKVLSSSWSVKSLEMKVNQFIAENPNIDIDEIKFSTTIFSYSAMIIYK